MGSSEDHLPTMDRPAHYRIRVRGLLDPADSRKLHGLTIETTTNEPGPVVTVLTGRLPDQAALAGVLDTLYSWLLPVLSVEHLAEGSA